MHTSTKIFTCTNMSTNMQTTCKHEYKHANNMHTSTKIYTCTNMQTTCKHEYNHANNMSTFGHISSDTSCASHGHQVHHTAGSGEQDHCPCGDGIPVLQVDHVAQLGTYTSDRHTVFSQAVQCRLVCCKSCFEIMHSLLPLQVFLAGCSLCCAACPHHRQLCNWTSHSKGWCLHHTAHSVTHWSSLGGVSHTSHPHRLCRQLLLYSCMCPNHMPGTLCPVLRPVVH